MDRRRFLQLGLGGAATVAARGLLDAGPASAEPLPGPFAHGVASGDPVAGGAIIWTRVTPTEGATPGSGLGDPTPVTWQVALDDAFATVVASGTVTSSAASDHTVKVDVAGLAASTEHRYRFQALGATSPVGRFRTAPAPGDARPLRFGIATCANWEGGYFSAYRHLAAHDDLDAVLHLGDYLYEYGVGAYGPGATFGRVHDPDVEMTTLEHYRRRHALYKTDPDLRALHQRYAFVTTIDDHEVTDNSHAGGAANHDATEGDYAARRAAAMQAYFEWMPIRSTGGAADPTRVWSQLSYGALADLLVLDERTHRTAQVHGLSGDLFVTSSDVDDPDRTMLGAEQLAWLEAGARASTANWRIVVNPVMLAPLVLGDTPDEAAALAPVFDGLGVAPPVVVNADQWDGYRTEQRRVVQLFDEVGGVVVVTGDIHSSWAAEIPADPATYAAGGPSVAVEFVTPAVTSDSFSAAVEGAVAPGAGNVSAALPVIVATAGPWFKYLDPDRHGFGVLDVAADAVRFDWWHISDRTDPAATVALGASWLTRAGTDRLERVAGPALQGPSGPSGPSEPGTDAGAPGSPPAPPPAPAGVDAGGGQLARTGGDVDGVVAVAAVAAGVAAAARAAARSARP
jgi:alkaline phosphatase D